MSSPQEQKTKIHSEDLSMYFRSEDAGGGRSLALMMMTAMMVAILKTKNNTRCLYSATYITQIFGSSRRQGVRPQLQIKEWRGIWVAQWLSIYLPLAQGMIPGSWDQVLHWAPCRESASPSAYASAYLSQINKQNLFKKKK